MSTHELIVTCIAAIPVAFLIGRYSTRVVLFRAQEQKLTVQEFMHKRQ